MSSLIATKVKTNMRLSFSQTLYYSQYLCATVYTYTMCRTIITTITIRSLFSSAHNLFVSNTLLRYSFHTTIRYATHNFFVNANFYSLDPHNSKLQTRNLS